MRTAGNVIWLILFGLFTGALLFIYGVIFCITLVGIPIGLKYFKLAFLALWPFGATVNANFEEHPFGNGIWLVCGGLSVAALEFLLGIILCVTIIGIPFAKQCFKLARYSISPFGAAINLAV